MSLTVVKELSPILIDVLTKPEAIKTILSSIGLAKKKNLTSEDLKAIVESKDFKTILSEEIKNNPVLVNQMNMEPLPSSRVMVGNSTAALGIVITGVIAVLKQFGIDIDVDVAAVVQFFAALGIVWGVVYAIYGRVKQGLKPLRNIFSRA